MSMAWTNCQGWSVECHHQPMIIRGRLERDKRPDLTQITLKSKPDQKEYFVVRNPTWERVERLLSPERASKEPR